MKSLQALMCVAALALTAGCIPFKGNVAVSGGVGAEIGQQAEPLEAGEGIAFLGRTPQSNRGIAACVRKAVAATIPMPRIIPAEQLGMSTGDAFSSNAEDQLTDEAIEGALHSARASAAVTDLKLRYVFIVDGGTSERNWHDSATFGVGYGSGEKSTDLQVAVWDAVKGQRLGALSTHSSGQPSLLIIGVIGFLEYTPTEAEACKHMAGTIQRYISGQSGGSSP